MTRYAGFAGRAFSPFTGPLTAAAKRVPADLYIAHYPAALPAAAIAARRHGALYAFDAEDFHLGDLPDGLPTSRSNVSSVRSKGATCRLRLSHCCVSRHRRRLCRGV